MTGDRMAGYRLPVQEVPTTAQLRPHESFKSEVIRPRQEQALASEGPRTPTLAVPPEWTREANCVGRWEEFDFELAPGQWGHPTGVDKRQAARMCEGCPLAPSWLGGDDLTGWGECLKAAMREEAASMTSATRAGIRGGLLPVDRANLERGLREKKKEPAA